MICPDESLKVLGDICTEFKTFCESSGKVSETDTRIKLIDRVLKEVLKWPETMLSREDHIRGEKDGYSDYSLKVKGRPYIVVEAKREGVSFELPITTRRRLKISGAMQKTQEVKDAIEQVRKYCIEEIPINYAIATNGQTWIIFKSIYKDKAWRDENAVIFTSLKDIESNFVKFWNILSFEAICSGSLENEFASIIKAERNQYRVIDNIINADTPLERNRLHAQLHPIIEAFFLDIADKDIIDILKSCYVHSRSVETAMLDFDNVVNDAIPLFLKKEGTKNVLTGQKDSGIFDVEVSAAIEKNTGNLYLLLGGIGSGKTTFIKRYLRITGHEVLDKGAVWFYISLLGPPSNPDELEIGIYTKILNELRNRYKSVITENRKTLKKLYSKELELYHETTLKAERLKDDEYEKRLSPFLEKLQDNKIDYVIRLLRECKIRNNTVIIYIDNVDQLSPEYQGSLFLLSQKITRDIGSLTILSLREESYYTASTQRTLTAYANKKFHIASPRFRKLIEYRLNYATKVLVKSEEELRLILKSGIRLDTKSILDFLVIIQKSIFTESKKIPFFIESICQGNMRLALEMFNTFLVSGATDVDKMLKIFKRSGSYSVAFHEFVKSVMLGEKRYYRETSDNPVMNIFECGTHPNSSHFTGLRLLSLLESRQNQYTPEGRGFVEWSKIQYEFENCFDNLDDLLFVTIRMLKWGLIEVNTKSKENLDNVNMIRITSSGHYYIKYLVKEFCYLDLVLQDTPIDDLAVVKQLTEYMKQVDNLSGKEEDKGDRILVRFNRVILYLEYLLEQESDEIEQISAMPINPIFIKAFVPEIIGRNNEQRKIIITKYEENISKYHKYEDLEVDTAEYETDEILPGFAEIYDVDTFDSPKDENQKK